MINLLPGDYKDNIACARRNRTLLNWTVALVLALALMGTIIAGGYLFMRHSISQQSEQSASAKQQLKDDQLDETKAKIDEISSNTKLVLQVLSREVLFSKLLKQLGASLPPGTTLQSINIDKVQGGITLKALARDIQSATQIQINLADPNNRIFQKADIESIICGPKTQSSTQTDTTASQLFPCSVQLRALFAKDNPYVYISNTSGGGQ
jgi:Tfp pilus assembly protein PilN